MGTPDPHDVCAELTLDVNLLGLKVTLPGGADLSVSTFVVPNAQQYSEKLLAQLNAALTPLIPFFKVLDVLLAVKDFVTAVPGVITNPGKVVSTGAGIIAKISGLARLLPQVSIPVAVKGILTLLITYIAAIRAQVVALVQVKHNIAAANARVTALFNSGAADAAANLQVITGCAQASLNVQMLAINEGAAPLNRLLGVVDLIGGLAGLPKLPSFSNVGTDPGLALAPIDALSKALTSARSAIPG